MTGQGRQLSLALATPNPQKASQRKGKKRRILQSINDSPSNCDEVKSPILGGIQREEVLTIQTEGTTKDSPTLLEKALHYRQENPAKWEEKQKENERTCKESVGEQDEDPFLEAYYERLDQIIEERRKLEEQRKLESPKVVLRIVYKLPVEEFEEDSLAAKTYSRSNRNVCVITPEIKDFDVYKRDPAETLNEKQPELIITVVKGKYLLNNIRREKDKYDTTRVKCKFYANTSMCKQVHKSEEKYVSKEGKTRWNHHFVLRGFTADQLKKSHIVLNVTGKKGEAKEEIGEAVLSGSKATIHVEGSDYFRRPTVTEACGWHRAIDYPGTCVDVVCDVLHSDEESLFGRTITNLQKKDLLLPYSKFKGHLRKTIRKARAPIKNFKRASL